MEPVHPLGGFSYGNVVRPVTPQMRGSGTLTPPPFPTSPFMDFPPYYARVLEGDVLMGRRGMVGSGGVWNARVEQGTLSVLRPSETGRGGPGVPDV